MYANAPEPADWHTAEPDGSAVFVDAAPPAGEEWSDGSLTGDRGWRPSGFIEWFAIGQTLLPALLFLPQSQPYRLPIRTGAYAMSLAAFALWWFHRGGRSRGSHPAGRWLILILLWLGFMLVHPDTPSLLLGIAQVSLYFAIFSPVFWAPAYVASRQKLMRILVILLLCNGLNSFVGVLQVYDPDRFMPRQLSALFTDEGGVSLGVSTYVGPNGRRIIRPPGLFDTPGAVCGAGTLAAILGLALCLERLAWWKRAAAFGLALAGISAIYLSHVRSSFVVAVGMIVAYIVMLQLQRERKRAIGVAGLAAAVIAIGLSGATMLGGESIQERFSTLLEGDPRELYYQSRGVQVQYALTDLVRDYPAGAGLGRWGMMSYYFGDRSGSRSRALFAEVQPNAWILDGGLPLLMLYSIALIVTFIGDLFLIRSLADSTDRLTATVVVAANAGTLALVLTFVPFGTAVGMQYWFLEGLLRGAMADRPRVVRWRG